MALWLVAAPALQEEGPARDPAPAFPIGEVLVYEARLFKGSDLLGGVIGRGEVSCQRTTHDGLEAIRCRAEASGEVFGFEVVQALESVLDASTGAPKVHTSSQSGTAIARKKTEFGDGKAEYWKMKHCKNEEGNCQEAHSVDGDPEKGHCTDRHCGRIEHRRWSLRDTVELPGTTYDPLSVVLAGRRSALGPDHPVEKFPVLVDDRLWEITVRAEDGGEVETPAGTFDTLLLALEPRYLNPKPWHEKEKFQGPFGLQGEIRIWVDKEDRKPVRVRGKVPFGIVMDAEIRLVEVRKEEGPEGEVKETDP
jgi:hypothetical protein